MSAGFAGVSFADGGAAKATEAVVSERPTPTEIEARADREEKRFISGLRTARERER
jgi:hypothetical protein